YSQQNYGNSCPSSPCPGPHLHISLTDIHSLCLNFTVKSQSRPGKPWCEVQGSVDKTSFLQYDSESNKIKPLGHLGKEVNTTKTWTELTQMLKEVGQDLRKILLDMDLEKNKTRRHLILQAKMFCQLKGKNHLGSFWNFSIDGQPSLCFNVMNMKWIVINPRARGLKEKWENDKELVNYFRKISMGDCHHWLTEFLERWKEMPVSKCMSPMGCMGKTGAEEQIFLSLTGILLFCLF
uniref:MHC class I-like antigen recognition-like domain-containing protein n=1 Tax=Sciurus vulgaris TaxID=55149 RepID=A0A8D2CWS8_SCIVU